MLYCVSVGVVLTTDNRVPMFAQTVVRAPGYTMRVEQVGGVSYSLLDADGNRRHGMIHNTNFCNGITALESGGKWAFRYRLPCRFFWDGKNTLTVGSGADGGVVVQNQDVHFTGAKELFGVVFLMSSVRHRIAIRNGCGCWVAGMFIDGKTYHTFLLIIGQR